MKDWAKSFYKSKTWQHMREYIMKRDGRLCQDCLKRGIVTTAEEVHHITPLTPENIMDPSVTLNENNLISLCRECHKARHGQSDEPKRYEIDEAGRVRFL